MVCTLCNRYEDYVKIIAALDLGLEVKYRIREEMTTGSGRNEYKPYLKGWCFLDFKKYVYVCKEFNTSHWEKWLKGKLGEIDKQRELFKKIKNLNDNNKRRSNSLES